MYQASAEQQAMDVMLDISYQHRVARNCRYGYYDTTPHR